ncbi:MAG: hypothetical protein M3Z24_10380 [Chloroflexota bacterium]|nr:hypothetical protein [Chloroflexota bacterium]
MRHSGFYRSSSLRQLCHIQRLLTTLHPQAEPQVQVVSGLPPRQDIIIFPSSFNPPTLAHLALMRQAQYFATRQMSYRHSIHIYAAMSKVTVDKEQVERPLLVERALLLQRVLRHRLPKTGILLFNRGLYVEQAQAIRACFPQVQHIYFLMGFDKIIQIFDARYYQDRDVALTALFAEAKLLVAPRGTAGHAAFEELLHQPENRVFAAHVLEIPLSAKYRAISSSRVRAQVDRYAVPYEVRQFMRSTRAYAPPIQQADGSLFDYYAQHVQRLQRLFRLANCEK